MTNSLLGAEVQLAWEVMTCLGMRSTYDRADSPCHWFNQHYGPYPAYSVSGTAERQALEPGECRELPATCKGMRFAVPELMSGCRKAPIMTIGINPNLTAYQHSVRGATWCYPYFDDIGKFADHFRNRTDKQARFHLSFIKQNILPGTEVIAPEDGEVTAIRLDTDNLAISVKYGNQKGGLFRVPVDYEVLCDPSTQYKKFAKGDVLAGRLMLPEDEQVSVMQQAVGYYDQFRELLLRFKSNGDAALQRSKVDIGEDACQGDMVACPSPGWNAYLPDDVSNGIVRECVEKRRYLLRQLAQTRPAVIVFAGSSSLQMFLQLGLDVQPPVNPFKDTMVLLKECLQTPYMLRYRRDGVSFDARLVFAPHFSYPDNFLAGCRLTADEWKSFKASHPDDARKVQEFQTDVYGGVLVRINPDDPKWKAVLSADAVQQLSEAWSDPVQMVAQVLGQEYDEGRLKLDDRGEHLVRADGPCAFCDNALFKLAGGCRYGKLDSKEDR